MAWGWPTDLSIYKLLTDWGSFIGGLITLAAGFAAYFAGRVQANATREAAASQIEAATRKDLSQARAIVVGIYPELLVVEATHTKTCNLIANGISPEVRGSGREFASAVRIDLPPLMERNVDHFFLIDPGGASLVQLVSIIGQYNQLLDIVTTDTNRFQYSDLMGHLEAISMSLKDAFREVAPLHDEATRKSAANLTD